MLPFLNAKKRAATIIDQRKASGEKSENSDNSTRLAHAILAAIEAKDVEALAMHLKAMIADADAKPHVEGEHI